MRIIRFITIVYFFVFCIGGQGAISAQDLTDEEILKLLEEQEIEMEPFMDAEKPKPIKSSWKEKEGEIVIDVLELKGMDILDVLKLISQKSGLNIVASNDVRGKITIYLKDVNVWDALKIILETNNLAYEKIGNLIKVIPDKDYEAIYGKKFNDKTQVKIIRLMYADVAEITPLLEDMKGSIGKLIFDKKSNTIVLMDSPGNLRDMENFIAAADKPVATKIFNLNYAKAEDLQKEIQGLLTEKTGSININTRTNKIVISDTPVKLEKISRVISAFDERHKEVLIQAKIIQVILSDQFEMGVDLQYLATTAGLHSLGADSDFSVLSSTDKYGKISVGTLSADDYIGFIEALNTIGTTNTLSSPHITALNNEEAKIMVGSTQPYVTTTTTTPASGPTVTAEEISFIDVGVKLFVTPTIASDGFITMKIRPEISAINSYLTTAENNTIPIVDTTESETTVMVKDGSTLIIAGLMKDENIKTVKKIPILGDIPLLKVLFRSKDDLVRKTETIVFLTPHIISGEADSYKVTEMPEFFKKKGH